MKRTFLLFLSLLVWLSAFAGVEVGNTYRIVPVGAVGMSLFVKDASLAVNSQVNLWTETDVPAQQWTVGLYKDEYYTFQNVYTQRYLAYAGTSKGATLRQVASASGGRWVLEPVDEEQNIYRLKPYTGSNCLASPAAMADGARPVLAVASDGEEQLWRFVETEPVTVFEAALREQMMDNFIAAFVKKHGSYKSFGSGGWGNAEMMEVGLDAYEATGRQDYLELCKSDYKWFSQNVGASWNHLVYNDTYNWFGHDFNDDVMWEIIAVSRLAWLTGEKAYLNAAKKNFDIIYKRAYINNLGMMRWAESSGDRNGTNSCINGPTEVAACYLGMAGAGEEYFEKARDLYELQRKNLANMTTGQVYDSFVWDPKTGKVARKVDGSENRNNWSSTYNQGTMLGAAVLLYEHYGSEQYCRDAEKIMSYTVKNLCNSDGIINVCQVNDGDLCGFKGIFMRYARRYVLDLNVPKYQEWTLKNALQAYNNRDDRGLTTSKWLAKSTRDVTTNAFSCSTAASAAVNAVTGLVQKNGLQTISAASFDYLRAAYVVKGSDDEPVISVKNGAWTAYNNLDFGDTPVQSLAVTIPKYAYEPLGAIEVCMDRVDAEPIATIPLSHEVDGQTVVAAVQPVTGVHHVFFRYLFDTNSRSNAYQVGTFQFSTLSVDELTGIGTVPSESANEMIYDLQGRVVNDDSLLPSQIYIVNGKKMIRKQ